MERIKNFFTEKYLTCLFLVVSIVTLLPIGYLSFINRATGDDYGYGLYTRLSWQSSHSLIALIQASFKTIRQYYYSWQGTWFDIFLFSLQPEVFSDKAYVITVFLMLYLWIGSTFLMFREILITRLGTSKWSYRLITIVFLLISIQFIPNTRSAIFWFNGCAHYMIPFSMCQFLVYSLLRFCRKYSCKWYVTICVLMALLGGANYQAALFALIVTFFVGGGSIIYCPGQRNKKIYLLIFPVILEMIGLIISMKAPGNSVRGGEDFGFSLSKGIATVGLSYVEGIRDIGDYIKDRPLIFVGLLFLFLVFLNVFGREECRTISYPVIVGLALYCLYSAMQAPAIYAGVTVSGGVYNTNYQVFLLTTCGILLIIAQSVARKFKDLIERFYSMIYMGGLMLCVIFLLIGRHYIKTSTFWACMEYISSGQAADYKEQMDLQTMLLTDKNTADVVLPFINGVQGPLCHMPVTEEADAWTNKVTGEFYGKNSVIAMPRPEWEELYGENIDGY